MSFPRYPKYKDSGVEWLATVPAHWGEVRGDAVIREKYESNKGMLSDNLLSLSFGRIVRKDVFSNDGLLPESFETYQVVDPGDIVFRPTDLQNDWNSLRSAIVEERGIITSAYIAVTSSVAVPRYLHYLFRAYDHTKVFYSMGGGLRQAFKFADLRRLPLLMPPLPEQTAIAAFLDRETAKIDALIAEQQRLIALLQEKRQAVISHAVTKGLNPNAPMKDSGIEWLGEVPEHWKTGRCRFYVDMLSGFAFPSQGFSDDEADWRLLRGINVGVGSIRWEDIFYWKREPDDGLNAYEMRQGDLVIGMDRPLISDGMRVARLTEQDVPSLLLQRVVRLTPLPPIDAEYLQHLLSSEMFVAHFAPETTGVSVPHISPDQIAAFVIPVPPIDEQKAIVKQVSEAIVKLAGLMNQARQSVDLLQERRSALISAAVTGQIDVRGLAGGSEAA